MSRFSTLKRAFFGGLAYKVRTFKQNRSETLLTIHLALTAYGIVFTTSVLAEKKTPFPFPLFRPTHIYSSGGLCSGDLCPSLPPCSLLILSCFRMEGFTGIATISLLSRIKVCGCLNISLYFAVISSGRVAKLFSERPTTRNVPAIISSIFLSPSYTARLSSKPFILPSSLQTMAIKSS